MSSCRQEHERSECSQRAHPLHGPVWWDFERSQNSLDILNLTRQPLQGASQPCLHGKHVAHAGSIFFACISAVFTAKASLQLSILEHTTDTRYSQPKTCCQVLGSHLTSERLPGSCPQLQVSDCSCRPSLHTGPQMTPVLTIPRTSKLTGPPKQNAARNADVEGAGVYCLLFFNTRGAGRAMQML